MTLNVVPELLEQMRGDLERARAAGKKPRQWHIAAAAFVPVLEDAKECGVFERLPGGDLILGLSVKIATSKDAPAAVLLCAEKER